MKYFILPLLIQISFFISPHSFGDNKEDCLVCHGEPSFVIEREKVRVSLYVNEKSYNSSIHGENSCNSCHEDVILEDGYHKKPQKVDCSKCHEESASVFKNSLHGKAVERHEKHAPDCINCHGKHSILSSKVERSDTYRFNIPTLCGKCHHEGSPIKFDHKINIENALSNYSEGIHGEGLFKRGLIASAICTDCHGSHNILPHEDKNSSINKKNLPKTCTKCHVLIEKVHKKIIDGRMWEKEPHKIPVCIDCHPPHLIRRVFYDSDLSNGDCLKCHGKPNFVVMLRGRMVNLTIDENTIKSSVHSKEATCVKCHTDSHKDKNPPCKNNKPVDCSICHAEVSLKYKTSIHGNLSEKGNVVAPRCTTCHGTHEILSRKVDTSPTYPMNVPNTCGNCHREGNKAAKLYTGNEKNIINNYTMSTHGKGLLESGLLVTAICTDCHTSHEINPSKNENSTVNRDNLPKTCSKCHRGIYEQFKESVHSPFVTNTKKQLPTCEDCHTAHKIERADKLSFKQNIISQCGKCHEKLTESYFETYHGKVSNLGYGKVAKCFDCHGAHNILKQSNPKSTLHRNNILNTCKKCHPTSSKKFAGYLTHATHHDRTSYPILFYVFWFMTLLLIATFLFFGAHTLLWLPRSLKEMKKRNKEKKMMEHYEVMRFPLYNRVLHLMVIISFFGLAITGMMLKFSYTKWASLLSKVLGGFETAGFVHRFCAIITFIYFIMHIGSILHLKLKNKIPVLELIFGKNSMMFNLNDLKEFIASIKWFVGLGPKPNYGRWTYWEKFDYFAVFWGVAVIGLSGLILWFPELFTRFLPGWLINVATIIHSDEALLAVGFIFTIHFFNSHLRPEKFPCDPVIFTGRVSLHELKEDRPREYEELMSSRRIKKYMATPLPKWVNIFVKVVGVHLLVLGITLTILIIYGMLFVYK